LAESAWTRQAQAGLSWRTILTKRAAYRAAFHGFDVGRVAAMTESDVDALLQPPAASARPADTVVRHRGKLLSAVHNAQRIQALRRESGAGLSTIVLRG
jgi:DNA-3-methyladenine glycosylase I